MELAEVTATRSENALPRAERAFAGLLCPGFDKHSMAQTHRLVRAGGNSTLSLTLDMAQAVSSWRASLERHRDELAVPRDRFPYGMAEAPWWQYCASPHSYLDLGGGLWQVGLNFLDRLLHLDLAAGSAHLVDPGVGDELLSSTNWHDAASGELWFASWPARDTVRRLSDPLAPARVTAWSLCLRSGRLRQAWQGEFGDGLHQLAVSPDRRFLLLTELGLRVREDGQGGLVPSGMLVVSLETGVEWRLPLPTAGHVEFDPGLPDVCYVSGHNIGLIGASVGIFGPGCIRKYRLDARGPELLGEFTDPRFHRVTTHEVFRHRGRTLIAVSGYPRRVFLIDAAGMRLHALFEQATGETVDASRPPHLCLQESYGIAPSPDGEAIVLGGTGFLQRLEVASGAFGEPVHLAAGGAGAWFTGHLGRLGAAAGRPS